MTVVFGRRHFVQDVVGLAGQRGAQILYPILLLSLLAGSLPVDGFAKLIFLLGLATWLAIVLLFGFDVSGTRQLALVTKRHERSLALARILSAQLAVLALVVSITLAMSPFLGPLSGGLPATLVMLVLAASQALVPRWHFRVSRQMTRLALFDVLPKLVSLPIVWLVAQETADTLLILCVMAAASIVTLIASWHRAIRELGPPRPALKFIIPELRDSLPIAVSDIAQSLYTTSGVILLGMLRPGPAVGFFGAAERMIRALSSVNQVIPQAMLPSTIEAAQTDPSSANRLVLRSALTVLALSTIVAGVISAAANPLILFLLGEPYLPAAGFLVKLVWLLPLYGLANVFGVQGLLALGERRPYMMVVGCCALFHLLFSWWAISWANAAGLILTLYATATLAALGHAGNYYVAVRNGGGAVRLREVNE